MAIQIAQLRDRCSKRLGSGGPSFDVHFVDCLNSVITDYNRQCDREIEYAETFDGELDVSQKHWQTFYLGTLAYLQKSKEWSVEPDDAAEAKYMRQLAMSQFEEITEDAGEAGIPEGDWAG